MGSNPTRPTLFLKLEIKQLFGGFIRIKVVPLGNVPDSILDRVKNALNSTFKMFVEIQRPERLPKYAYNPIRNQYRSDLLLDFLAKHFKGRVLGITNEDLYVEGLNFVFGQAQLNGRVAIVSFARLDPTFFHQPEDQELLEKRVEKEVIHEIGHVLGLRHCETKGCVMNFSNTVFDVDKKTKFFCKNCRAKLGV